MKKQLRTGKVLVDWSQNDEHKTTVSIYSLRAREHPTVSTPVKWEEVEEALKKKDAGLLVFEAGQVLDRVQRMGDLFEPRLSSSKNCRSFPRGKKDPVPEKGIDSPRKQKTKRGPRKKAASPRSAATKKRRKV